MLGVQVVVPQKLQRRVLEELHQAYPGMIRIILLVEPRAPRY